MSVSMDDRTWESKLSWRMNGHIAGDMRGGRDIAHAKAAQLIQGFGRNFQDFGRRWVWKCWQNQNCR